MFEYPSGKPLEWAMSVSLLITGIAILIWPKTCNGGTAQILVSVFGGMGTAILFINVGMFGLVALIANGRSLKIGPKVRAITAAIRAVMWATFTLSMIEFFYNTGTPPIVLFFFFSFTITEIYIAWRAMLDVRTSH